MFDEIQDHLKHNLNILFVGFNPSIRSGETGHHFANPTNRFWKVLYRANITPILLEGEEDYKLLEFECGLTNIVARPTKAATDITKEEYEVGRVILKEKIEKYKPKVVCFVGKGVYEQFAQKKSVPWGRQDVSIVKGTIDFVAPSSSGLVRMSIDEITDIYKQIHNLF
ncbi:MULTISPECIES: G/U mismatch-specific DNA glycosylase [Bacillus]|uniref:G/U mismatch-specific DNA glycosylase n=1 Tax=Bacillus TaxID=1386 RepID=UPI000BB809CE|nr:MULTISPECIES: G/U mismatch-specific DNA glycosylase [Bacillus]